MIRAQVAEDWSRFGIVVLISQHTEDGKRIATLHFNDGIASWDPPPTGATQIDPTLRLDHEEANALLAALTNHYQGVDDQRALRKDYDHERGRVDKLIDVVTAVAQQRPTTVVVRPPDDVVGA